MPTALYSLVLTTPPDTREVVRWTDPEYDVSTRVHEYGGGSFTVYNNTLYFSRGEDDAIYRQDGPGARPSRLTPISKKRYADGMYSPKVSTDFKGVGKDGAEWLYGKPAGGQFNDFHHFVVVEKLG